MYPLRYHLNQVGSETFFFSVNSSQLLTKEDSLHFQVRGHHLACHNFLSHKLFFFLSFFWWSVTRLWWRASSWISRFCPLRLLQYIEMMMVFGCRQKRVMTRWDNDFTLGGEDIFLCHFELSAAAAVLTGPWFSMRIRELWRRSRCNAPRWEVSRAPAC